MSIVCRRLNRFTWFKHSIRFLPACIYINVNQKIDGHLWADDLSYTTYITKMNEDIMLCASSIL